MEIPAKSIARPINDSDFILDSENASRIGAEGNKAGWLQRVDGVLAWPLRKSRELSTFFFGWLGLILLLGILATVPVLQFAVLGFFVLAGNRVATSGKISSGWIGLRKGQQILGLILGIGLTLIPLRWLVYTYRSSLLINGAEAVSDSWIPVQTLLLFLTTLHMFLAVLSGGRMFSFLWPLVLPFSLGKWIGQTLFRWIGLTGVVRSVCYSILPQTTEQAVLAYPSFGPHPVSILWNRFQKGELISKPANDFWQFIREAQFGTLLKTGFIAFVGTVAWFAGPVFWFSASLWNFPPVISGFLYFFGVIHLLLSLNYFPMVCSCFAATLNWRAFFFGWSSSKVFQASPLRTTMVLALSVVLSVPVVLFRVEMIPYGLWWILAVPTVAFSWLIWILWGWAWFHSTKLNAVNLQDLESADTGPVERGANSQGEGILFLNKDSSPSQSFRSFVTPGKKTSFLWRSVWRVVYFGFVIGHVLLMLLSFYLSWEGIPALFRIPLYDLPSPFFHLFT